jgi:hypothetical protein
VAMWLCGYEGSVRRLIAKNVGGSGKPTCEERSNGEWRVERERGEERGTGGGRNYLELILN